MKKVVYSLTRFRKYENQVRKGIGYITDEDLIITVFKNGKEEKRTFEDCLRYCHKIITTEDQYTGHFTEYENVEIPDKYGAYQIIELEVEYKLWYKIIGY